MSSETNAKKKEMSIRNGFTAQTKRTTTNGKFEFGR